MMLFLNSFQQNEIDCQAKIRYLRCLVKLDPLPGGAWKIFLKKTSRFVNRQESGQNRQIERSMARNSIGNRFPVQKYVGAQRIQDRVSGFPQAFSQNAKKREKSDVATKLSFSAPNQSFFDRLDAFPIARLLKITLVLLFFQVGPIFSDSPSLVWSGAHTEPFQFLPNQSNSDAKKRSASQWCEKYYAITKISFVAPNQSFSDRLDSFSIDRLLKNMLVVLFLLIRTTCWFLRASVQRGLSFCPNLSISDAKTRSASYRYCSDGITEIARCELPAKRGSERR